MKIALFGLKIETSFDRDELEMQRIDRMANRIIRKEMAEQQAKARADEIRAQVEARKEQIAERVAAIKAGETGDIGKLDDHDTNATQLRAERVAGYNRSIAQAS